MEKRRIKKLWLGLLMLGIITILNGCGIRTEKLVKQSENQIEITYVDGYEVEKMLDAKESKVVLIDTRSYDEYNGWDLEGNGINGHIKGAKNYPTTALKDGNMKLALENKNLTKDLDLVLYGKDSKEMALALKKEGFKVEILKENITKWNAKNYPIEKLKNYQTIVPVTWVKDLLDGKEVKYYDGRPVKVFDIAWDEKGKSYSKGHIPGTYWFHTGWVEEGPLWNKVSDEKIEKALLKQGITHNTLLLIYGEPMAAARVGAIAKYAGVEDVRVINGGLKAWKDAGYKVEEGIKTPTPEKDFGVKVPNNPNIIVDIPGALKILKSDKAELVSIRSWKEYQGKISGYDYIKPRGRIKGSKWGGSGSDAHHLEAYRAVDQFHMRPYTEIEDMWKNLNIDKSKELGFYCGTGWRASEVWFYAQAMGLDNSVIYDGGWKEWSENKETKEKVLKGTPEKLNEEKY